MSANTFYLPDTVYTYLLQHTLRDTPVLKALREETATMTGGHMQISPEQGQLMSLLMELINAKKTLDIGTFTGYSALVVAQALPDDGNVIACDLSQEAGEIAHRYWQEANVAHKIDLKIGPALNTLNQLIADKQSGSFDFVFIDADKSNYIAYYEKALTLLRPGGLIGIDNVLWSGRVADPQEQGKTTLALRAINEKLIQDQRVTMSMIPIGDGLTLARKK